MLYHPSEWCKLSSNKPFAPFYQSHSGHVPTQILKLGLKDSIEKQGKSFSGGKDLV